MKAKKIPLIFTRDFPVLLLQIWGRRYRSFFGARIKTQPQMIFLINDGLAAVHRNVPAIHQEINEIFKKKFKTNENFFKIFLEEKMKQVKALEKKAKQKKLSRTELLKYAEELTDLWTALYASLFLPPDKSVPGRERKMAFEFREQTDKLEYFIFNRIFKALNQLYPKLGPYAKYISWDEIKRNKVPSLETLVKRAKHLIIYSDELIGLQTLKKRQEKFNFILEQVKANKNLRLIKGQIAYPGKVRGRIRKILGVSAVKNLKAGEILVSYMTIPDFLPAMKKAAAFITDEGGITCHAAIVARELKKPCLIGTKLASKIFNDGDLVEVDANKGTVKKI